MRILTVYQPHETHSVAFNYTQKMYRDTGIIREIVQDYFPGDVFSYTKMVREYLGEYEGIVAVMDADVYCGPEQLKRAGEITKRGYAFVLPYDGRVYENMGIEPRGPLTDKAVGGIQVYNYGVYRRMCGGENPNFKIWGDEDIERYERVKKFMRIPRIKGYITHYSHVRTEPRHEYAEANLAEANKVGKMTAEEVEEYVKTW